MDSKRYSLLPLYEFETINTPNRLEPQKRVTEIHRAIQNKNAKHNIKERSRILHEFTLSKLLIVELENDGSFHKVMANLRQFKDLRCLNIDLSWLGTCYRTKRLGRFVGSLKHLKNVSTLYFYTLEPFSDVERLALPFLFRLLKKYLKLSKMRIQLYVTIDLQVFLGYEFLKICGRLERFTSVDITFKNGSTVEIPRYLLVFENSRCLLRLSIAIVMHWSDSGQGLEYTFNRLVDLKSVKDFRVLTIGSRCVTSWLLKRLLPFIKEIAKRAKLELVFSGFKEGITTFTRVEQWRFQKSIAKINTLKRIRTRFVGEIALVGTFQVFGYFFLLLAILLIFSSMRIPPEDAVLPGVVILFMLLFIFLILNYYFENKDRTKELETVKSLLKKELENISLYQH